MSTSLLVVCFVTTLGGILGQIVIDENGFPLDEDRRLRPHPVAFATRHPVAAVAHHPVAAVAHHPIAAGAVLAHNSPFDETRRLRPHPVAFGVRHPVAAVAHHPVAAGAVLANNINNPYRYPYRRYRTDLEEQTEEDPENRQLLAAAALAGWAGYKTAKYQYNRPYTYIINNRPYGYPAASQWHEVNTPVETRTAEEPESRQLLAAAALAGYAGYKTAQNKYNHPYTYVVNNGGVRPVAVGGVRPVAVGGVRPAAYYVPQRDTVIFRNSRNLDEEDIADIADIDDIADIADIAADNDDDEHDDGGVPQK